MPLVEQAQCLSLCELYFLVECRYLNPLKDERVEGGCVNAKEYRAYREEHEYLKENNRKITLVSAVYAAPSTVTLNGDKVTSKSLIRATLNEYSKLNAEIEKLRAIIHNYKAHAGVAIYGNTAIHTSTKRDLSDTLAKVEDNKCKFVRLVFMERWLENALYGLHGLRAEYIIYIIEVYLRGKKEPERRKVARIIEVIHEKGLGLPTIEQAQIVINENGKR